MRSKNIFRMDVGFYMGIALWALLKSFYSIHVFWACQKMDGSSSSPKVPRLRLPKQGPFRPVWLIHGSIRVFVGLLLGAWPPFAMAQMLCQLEFRLHSGVLFVCGEVIWAWELCACALWSGERHRVALGSGSAPTCLHTHMYVYIYMYMYIYISRTI